MNIWLELQHTLSSSTASTAPRSDLYRQMERALLAHKGQAAKTNMYARVERALAARPINTQKSWRGLIEGEKK